MHLVGILLLFSLGVAAVGWAQDSIPKVDYHTGMLFWEWARGAPPDDGMVEHFRVKCGPASEQYTYPPSGPIQPPEPPNTIVQVPIKSVVPSHGVSYCIVVSVNPYGERASVPVPFAAGAAPAAAKNVGLR